LDEHSKKEIRRKTLKAIAIPGYQVPFASRELPIARGWGTGGLQLTLSLVGREDILKVIDQGSDESVNAVNIRNLIQSTTGVKETIHTSEASLIQSRHRIPEVPLKSFQILVLQVPMPEPLRTVEISERTTKMLQGDKENSAAIRKSQNKNVTATTVATEYTRPIMSHASESGATRQLR